MFYELMTNRGYSNEHKNEYKVVVNWEKWATEHLPSRFGLDVYEICTDKKRNHDEGTDAILRNFCGKGLPELTSSGQEYLTTRMSGLLWKISKLKELLGLTMKKL